MLRNLLDAVMLFLVPFVAYALLLGLRRRYPFVLDSWTRGPLATLAVTGLALAVAGALLTGLFANRHKGAYVPAHIENGKLVPGRID